MVIFSILVCILVFLVLKRHQHWKRLRASLPPGPPVMPILGSLPFLSAGCSSASFTSPDMAKYGPLVSVWLGSRLFILVQDFKLCKEMFGGDHVAGRTNVHYKRETRGSNGRILGIIHTNGDFWKDQRRFVLRSLKNFGFGSSKMDDIIRNEASFLVESLSAQAGEQDVRFEYTFNNAAINVLWQIVASKRYNATVDPQDALARSQVYFTRGISALNNFETLKRFLPNTQDDFNMIQIKETILQNIHERQQTFKDYVGEPRDFLDEYLAKIEAEKERLGPAYSSATSNYFYEQLVFTLLDLFMAGSETTSTTLLWCVMFMALNPGVQDKCREEIRRVLGARLPGKDDQPSLPYCVATIMEVQRMGETGPTSLPHVITSDITVNGYKLKKGTNVLASLSSFLKDPKTFPDPYRFDPERFLIARRDLLGPGSITDPDALVVNHNVEKFVPFSYGRRVCLGESLAKCELFIFFVTFLQNFQVDLPRNNPVPDPLNSIRRFTNMPKPFYASLTPVDPIA